MAEVVALLRRRHPSPDPDRTGWHGQDAPRLAGRRRPARRLPRRGLSSCRWLRCAIRSWSPRRSRARWGCEKRGGGRRQRSCSRRLAGKRLLLVLDNFEQVLDAAPFVGELLASSPALECWPPAGCRCAAGRARVPGAAAGAAAPYTRPRRRSSASTKRCGSSSSGRKRSGPTSRSRRRTPRRWRRSAGGWTGCRWPSSWRRRGYGSSPQRAAGAAGEAAAAAHGRASRRPGPAADAARRDRLEPRPALLGRADPLPAAGGLRRRGRARRRRRRWPTPEGELDVFGGLDRLVEHSLLRRRGAGWRAALHDAGDDPGVRAGAAGGER